MYWREKSFYCLAQRWIKVCVLIRKMVVTFAYKSNYMLHIQEYEHYCSSNSEIYYKNTLRSAYRSNSSRTINLNRFPLFVFIYFISPFLCLILLSQEPELHSWRRRLKGLKSPEKPQWLFSLPHCALVATCNGKLLPGSGNFRAGLRVAPPRAWQKWLGLES